MPTASIGTRPLAATRTFRSCQPLLVSSWELPGQKKKSMALKSQLQLSCTSSEMVPEQAQEGLGCFLLRWPLLKQSEPELVIISAL